MTRWRADGTRDDTGQFCYVKDLSAERAWSAAHQPVCAPADWYRALLATDRVTFHRADGDDRDPHRDRRRARGLGRGAAGDRDQQRRPSRARSSSRATARSCSPRPSADRAHPAFGNLFVETEWHDWCSAITATRRPRSAKEQPLWCVHVVDTGPERVGRVDLRDRSRALRRPRPLDPRPGGAGGRRPALGHHRRGARSDLRAPRPGCGCGPGSRRRSRSPRSWPTTRERAFELADRYHDPHAAQRALDLAWTSTPGRAARAAASRPGDAAVFQELAGHLFYGDAALRAPPGRAAAEPRLAAAALGASASPATGRSCSRRSTPPRDCRRCASCSRRTATGAAAGMTVDLVVLNAHAAELPAGAERPDHGRGLAVERLGFVRPPGRRVRPAARPARRRRAAHAARHRARAHRLRRPRRSAGSSWPRSAPTSAWRTRAALAAPETRRAGAEATPA